MLPVRYGFLHALCGLESPALVLCHRSGQLSAHRCTLVPQLPNSLTQALGVGGGRTFAPKSLARLAVPEQPARPDEVLPVHHVTYQPAVAVLYLSIEDHRPIHPA